MAARGSVVNIVLITAREGAYYAAYLPSHVRTSNGPRKNREPVFCGSLRHRGSQTSLLRLAIFLKYLYRAGREMEVAVNCLCDHDWKQCSETNALIATNLESLSVFIEIMLCN